MQLVEKTNHGIQPSLELNSKHEIANYRNSILKFKVTPIIY